MCDFNKLSTLNIIIVTITDYVGTVKKEIFTDTLKLLFPKLE